MDQPLPPSSRIKPRSTRSAPLVRSCGIIPVRRVGDSWRFLVLRVYAYWDFPKGMVDPGEDPWAAAVRELAEETGLTDPEFRWGLDFHETAPYSYGKVARYYLAEVKSGDVVIAANPQSGIVEHHEFKWGTESEIASLLSPRVHAALDWANAKLDA